MKLVNEYFEVEILAAFRVGELSGMTEHAITGRSPHTPMIFERIVTIVARSGFNHVALEFDLAAGGNKFVKRIGDIFAAAAGELSADDVGGIAVVVRR